MGGGVGRFLFRSAVYAGALLVVLAATYYGVDPLRTARSYTRYYDDDFYPNTAVVGINNFNARTDRRKYDSFILGNSLSKAVRVDDWKRHLPEGALAYHLSSDCQHLPLSLKMLEYAADNVDSLRHVLLYMSVWSLQDSIDSKPAALPHPDVFDGLQRWKYRALHFAQAINRPAIIMGISLRMAGRLLYTPRMSEPLRTGISYNSQTNELLFVDEINHADTVSQADDAFVREWQFYNKVPLRVNSDRVTPRVASLLMDLKAVADSCGATLDVMIVPDEDRTVLSAHDVEIMTTIFGSHFHDLTWKRVMERNDIRNFYDPSHFDPDMTGRFLDDALGDKEE